ncbi:MAG: hypothetical protein ACYTGL_08375 [Planctomycetota bacterium]|jgi:hypothetical protein
MAKRKTREVREREAKLKLRQRIDDLFIGATGQRWNESDGEPWPQQFMAFVQAIKATFGVEKDENAGIEGNTWLWNLWNLENYRTPEAATDFLFDNGVTA